MITHKTLAALRVDISQKNFDYYCSVVPNAQTALGRMIDPQSRNTPAMIADAIKSVPHNDSRGRDGEAVVIEPYKVHRRFAGSFAVA